MCPRFIERAPQPYRRERGKLDNKKAAYLKAAF